MVEPHWHGHQATYLRAGVRSLLRSGHRVTAFCPFPEIPLKWLDESYPELCANFAAFRFLRPSPVAPGTPWPGRAFVIKFWRETAQAIGEQNLGHIDLVYLSWMDTYVHPFLPGWMIDRHFPYRWTGLYFWPGEYRNAPHLSRMERWLLSSGFPFRSKKCVGVGLLDEQAQQSLDHALRGRPVVLFPDVVDETPDGKAILGPKLKAAATGRKVVACIGSLSKRKGMLELMRICQQTAAKDWFFAFTGHLDLVDFDDQSLREILRFLNHPPPNVWMHLHPVADVLEFDSLVLASDVLYCHYLEFRHSSNLLTKAAVHRRPVLVSDGYCMAERVRRHHLGVVVREGDPHAILRGLESLLNDPNTEGRDFDGYAKLHAVERLDAAFEALLSSNETKQNRQP